jgi:hypothetical protein
VLLDFYDFTGEHWDPPAHHQGAKFENGPSSNDPTNQQAVTLTPHDTLIHRS